MNSLPSRLSAGLSRLPRPVQWGGFVVLYVLLDGVSFVHDFQGLSFTPWNPHSGLALAFLARLGGSCWPIMVIAEVAADELVRSTPPVVSVLSGLCKALVYAVAIRFLRWDVRGERLFAAMPQLCTFFGVALAISLLGTFSRVLFVTGIEGGIPGWFWQMLIRNGVGDLVGIIVFAPLFLLLTAVRCGTDLLSWERLSQIFVAIALTAVVFGLEMTDEFKFFYILFLPIIWAAQRSGMLSTLLLLALIQSGMILATFSRDMPDGTVIGLQVLMLILCLTGMVIAVSVQTRQGMDAAMRERWEELSRLGRIHATSEVAAGLAHELKQPLLAVINFMGAARRQLEKPVPDIESAVASINDAEAQVLRADQTIRRIRAFVQKGEISARPLDVTGCVSEAVTLVSPLSRQAGVRIEAGGDSGLPLVMADEIQVLQIIVNLLSNAIQAIDEAETPPAARWIGISAHRHSDHMVEVTVADSGPGLAPPMLADIFQPFVTSRPEGIGIGLSISRIMAHANGGKLWHDLPRPGHGATFRLLLPVAEPFDAGKT